MAFPTDYDIHSLARSAAAIRLQLDLRQAEGTKSLLTSVIESAFAAKLAELTKRVGSEEAHRLIRHYIEEIQQEKTQESYLAGRKRDIDGLMHAQSFADLWLGAWQSKKLGRLLSLFHDDATYINATLRTEVHEKLELGSLFGRMLHNGGAITKVGVGWAGGKTIVRWKRSGANVRSDDCGRLLPSRQSIAFEGTSIFDVVDDLVVTCHEDWSEYPKAIQQTLFDQSNPPRQDLPGIVFKDGKVWIGGIPLERRHND
jgi:hypothetical protein